MRFSFFIQKSQAGNLYPGALHAPIGAFTEKVDPAHLNHSIWRSRVPIRAQGICVNLKAALRNPL
jgi:hypothetical protein